MNTQLKWTKTAMSVQFSEASVTTVSESENDASIEFGNLKNANITGFKVNFKKDEIPNLIKMLQQFSDTCF
jgi:hypothetical protein